MGNKKEVKIQVKSKEKIKFKSIKGKGGKSEKN